jgi:hypothetical protein
VVAPSERSTLGQRAFWDRLDAAQRERFTQLSPGRQRQILDAVRDGAPELLLAVILKELRPVRVPPAPTPETLTEDLIRLLADPFVMGQTLLPRATEAVRQDLGDEQKNYPYWHGELSKVVTGEIPAESVLEPLRKTQEQIARGNRKARDNPAAYCTASHVNWLRENVPARRDTRAQRGAGT